ncbi:hypothetical protein [Pseudomonas sp.]|uniref:hypothetical protein n=1 Tax=Pseudomonas sp. TaxID=306 RepID=UPI0025911FB5|nr:hypothetical protein [Pseudomonas sp.]
MDFKHAFERMKSGVAIALPEWGGYWRWDATAKSVAMHLRTGEIMDMRTSPDMEFTLGHTFRDDWLEVADTSGTEHAQARRPNPAHAAPKPAGHNPVA